jgi:hypothetical protein
MELTILPQPDDNSCGPTSLHAVYRYYGLEIELPRLIGDIRSLETGGTLAVYLGIDALRRGMDATIYSYNLKMFDPTWAGLDTPELITRLELQQEVKNRKRFLQASHAYIGFLRQGGRILFDQLTPELLKGVLELSIPILTGLSATYLYNSMREISRGRRSYYDDIAGEPMGHFVVLTEYSAVDMVKIADPYSGNPLCGSQYYILPVQRLINAIHLGSMTYDANLLIVQPARK